MSDKIGISFLNGREQGIYVLPDGRGILTGKTYTRRIISPDAVKNQWKKRTEVFIEAGAINEKDQWAGGFMAYFGARRKDNGSLYVSDDKFLKPEERRALTVEHIDNVIENGKTYTKLAGVQIAVVDDSAAVAILIGAPNVGPRIDRIPTVDNLKNRKYESVKFYYSNNCFSYYDSTMLAKLVEFFGDENTEWCAFTGRNMFPIFGVNRVRGMSVVLAPKIDRRE